jgi:hypothetical protein
MGLFGKLFKSGFEKMLDTASDEELAVEMIVLLDRK